MRVVIDTSEIWRALKLSFHKISSAHDKLIIWANTSIVFSVIASIVELLVVVTIILIAWYGDPDKFPFGLDQKSMKIFATILAGIGLCLVWVYSRTCYFYFFNKEKYHAYVKETTLLFSKPLPQGTDITVEYIYTENGKKIPVKKK